MWESGVTYSGGCILGANEGKKGIPTQCDLYVLSGNHFFYDI